MPKLSQLLQKGIPECLFCVKRTQKKKDDFMGWELIQILEISLLGL